MILVMIMAITAAFAFRPAGTVHSGKTTYYWFKLNPGGNPNQKSDYTRQASKPSCSGGANVCSVQAPDDGTMHPDGIPQAGPAVPNGVIQAVEKKS